MLLYCMVQNCKNRSHSYSRPNQTMTEAWDILNFKSMLTNESSDVLKNSFFEIFTYYYRGLSEDSSVIPAGKVSKFLNGLLVELASEFNAMKGREASLRASIKDPERGILREAPTKGFFKMLIYPGHTSFFTKARAAKVLKATLAW